MKKIILLFVFASFASLSFGQFKVVSSGENRALNKTLVVGSEAGSALARVIVGRDRTSTGGAAIDFRNGDGTAFGTRFSRGANGNGALTHQGTAPLQIITQNAAPIEFKTNNSSLARMTIQSTGQIDIRGNATVMGGTNVTSDSRLKKNVNQFDLGLETVLEMNPVSYDYTGAHGSVTNRAFVGLIAQELQKIAPDFVSNNTFVERDEDGNVVSEDVFLQIHDSELKYILVNAIKDQQSLIDAQTNRIEVLEELITSGTGSNSINSNVTLTSYDLAELGQNTPNPFNGQTYIKYIVPTDAQNSSINIFGSNGQLLREVSIDHVGEGELAVDAQDLNSGTYSYQLVVDGRALETKKMVLSK